MFMFSWLDYELYSYCEKEYRDSSKQRLSLSLQDFLFQVDTRPKKKQEFKQTLKQWRIDSGGKTHLFRVGSKTIHLP